ncbi:MAG: DUF3795 domain-containing protein [Candidatus Bipolaricaulota bacterium]|nr:DUF3795 domain-containing protein [Candidatus Bipolaricaulota bacterium]
MARELRACCGLVCTKCPAYIAKRTDDNALRAMTAKEWAGPDFPHQAGGSELRRLRYDARKPLEVLLTVRSACLRVRTRGLDVRRVRGLRV